MTNATNKMTAEQKAQVIAKYLKCDGYRIMTDFGQEYNESLLQYEEGSNEGCYMTIGGYVFRDKGSTGKTGQALYVNAIQLYLTLV